MADAELRKLERDALQGDEQARAKLLRELLRTKPNTWEGLAADVIARPDDDLPRLVFARWLRDQGQVPRAELIEHQITLARNETYASVLKRLRREVPPLIERHQRAWLQPLKVGPAKATFERGFVAELECDLSRLLAQGETVFAREPIERLSLTGCSAQALQTLCAAPWIGRVTRLKLRGRVGDAGAAVLAAAPGLAHLRGLNLGECGIGPAGAQALAASATLTSLESLSLSGNELGDDGVVPLAESPALANLKALYLARTELGDDGLRALADSPHLNRLERLGLDGVDASDGGWSRLATARGLEHLEWLEITGWGGPRGEALAQLQERFKKLRRK